MKKQRIIYIILGVVAIFFVFGPISSLVIWSFAKQWYWPHALPQEWGTLYWKLVGSTTIMKSLLNSLIVGAATTAVCIVLSVPLAYVIARRNFPFKTGLLLLFLLPQAFPQLPIFVNLLQDLYRLDLAGTYTGIILVEVTIGLLYSVWVMTAVFQSIPHTLELAAYNYGASPLQAFFHIVLPNAVPGIVASAILVFLNSIDEFTGALLVGAPYVTTLSVYMYNTAMGYEMQAASVSALLLSVPGIVMLIVLNRFLKAEYFMGFGKA